MQQLVYILYVESEAAYRLDLKVLQKYNKAQAL